MFLEDLEATVNKDTIRIMSGEANSQLYNQVGETTRKHCQTKELRFEVIAGPIISVVQQDNGQKKNAIIDLAKADFFDMYQSKIRRELHFRIVENRIMRGELPHSPGDYNDRLGFTIDVNKIQDQEEKRMAIFAIENRIKDFEAAKVFCEHVPPDEIEERFILLTNEQISSLQEKASKKGLSIDRIPKDEILRIFR